MGIRTLLSMKKGGRATKRWAAVATAAAISVALAACSSGGSGGSASGAIVAWGTTADKPIIQPSIAQWNKDHPDAKITDSYFGTNDFKSKIKTAVGSPQAPQLVYNWGGGTLSQYVKAGLVKDLSSDVTSSGFLDNIVPSIAAIGQVDGKTYALPMSSTAPVVLYYNKDVLSKAGISEAPATWDDLLADVKTLKGKGISPISIGGQSQWPYLMWLEYLVDRVGGPTVFQNIIANKPNAWSDPAVLESLKMIQSLVKADGFAKGFSTVSADTNADLALMVTGKAAFMLQGTWSYSGISSIDPNFVKDGKLGVAPFPAVTGGKGDPKDIAGNPSVYWSISSKASTAQAKTALDYMTKYVWTDSYDKTVLDQGSIPPTKDAATKLTTDFAKNVDQMINQAPSFTQSWDLALSPAASTAFWTQLSLLFGLSETPQQFVDNMNKTIGK